MGCLRSLGIGRSRHHLASGFLGADPRGHLKTKSFFHMKKHFPSQSWSQSEGTENQEKAILNASTAIACVPLQLSRQHKFPARTLPGETSWTTIRSSTTTESAMKKTQGNICVFMVDIRANRHQIRHVGRKLCDSGIGEPCKTPLSWILLKLTICL